MRAAKRRESKKISARTALLDSAEQLISEQGAQAITTRSIASNAGLKFQVMYYYFETLEDLLVEVYDRVATRQLDQLKTAMGADRPLRILWDLQIAPMSTSGVIAEFVSLSNQFPKIHAAIAAHAERLREMEVAVIENYVASRGINLRVSAMELAVLLASLSRTLRLEQVRGMSLGHDSLKELVGRWLSAIEAAAEGKPQRTA